MMLGEVIRQVEDALVPINVKMTIGNAILDPKVPHGHGFGAPKLDGTIGDAGCGGIVGLDGSGALGMTKFIKGDTNRFSIASIVKNAT